MAAVYGVILNQELFKGVQAAHGDITMRMLNKLSNAETASQLPARLITPMRRILYLGYRNIVIAAVILIVVSLVVVVPLAFKRHPRVNKKGYDAHN